MARPVPASHVRRPNSVDRDRLCADPRLTSTRARSRRPRRGPTPGVALDRTAAAHGHPDLHLRRPAAAHEGERILLRTRRAALRRDEPACRGRRAEQALPRSCRDRAARRPDESHAVDRVLDAALPEWQGHLAAGPGRGRRDRRRGHRDRPGGTACIDGAAGVHAGTSADVAAGRRGRRAVADRRIPARLPRHAASPARRAAGRDRVGVRHAVRGQGLFPDRRAHAPRDERGARRDTGVEHGRRHRRSAVEAPRRAFGAARHALARRTAGRIAGPQLRVVRRHPADADGRCFGRLYGNSRTAMSTVVVVPRWQHVASCGISGADPPARS